MKKEQSIGELASRVYELLRDVDAGARSRVLAATTALFADPMVLPKVVVPGSAESGLPGSEAAFFEEKQPKTKGEELAVAAMYRELSQGVESHTKDDLKAVFRAARRPFDAHNFRRDMDNARRQAGFFLPVGSDGGHQLSAYGQRYVNALPDRDALKSVRRVGRGPKRVKRGSK